MAEEVQKLKKDEKAANGDEYTNCSINTIYSIKKRAEEKGDSKLVEKMNLILKRLKLENKLTKLCLTLDMTCLKAFPSMRCIQIGANLKR